jgi:hypothetical protein
MNTRFLPRLFAVLTFLIVFSIAPTSAQGPDENPRAPQSLDLPTPTQPDPSFGEENNLLSPEWGGHWFDGAVSDFSFTRFDGGYFLPNNKVYFMGGRLADGTTNGRVWAMNLPAFTYTDKGIDLVTPVSNYTMNLLEDATGFGFYIFCGRNSVGTQVDSVQIYYPVTNTVVQLGPEDNYQGSGTCTAGLNVVYKNKVYIAGGLDSASSPYNWGETWVFDPMAPIGSRWTAIHSAPLTRPRGYMTSALVDTKIYAIGGNYYDPTLAACGQELCMVNTVEVLDLSQPAPSWNDAAAADLPELCSDGRAYGFDTTSQFKDIDGTRLGGKIISTCGGWSIENERVYVYDTQRNTWNAFPSLNRTRRNQAAEFVPASYSGLGLLGMWGGRNVLDTNVLNIPEGYWLGTGRCSVLLVDDDWDFDSVAPNDGGRPYYSSAINQLGYRYTVWDTVSQGTPSVAELAKYNITVWFTGYDYETPISPTEQTRLISYLNSGGNLIMSSIDQYKAFPGSTIMSDYFGVQSLTPDIELKSIASSSADPLYAKLGAYTLVRPDDVIPYWPTGILEGPYNDVLLARAGAYTPTVYTPSGQASSTRYTNGVFKTVYMAFPLEWVNTIQERAQILGPALKWMCPDTVYLPVITR